MKKKNMKSFRTIYKDASMVLNEEKDQFRVRDLKPFTLRTTGFSRLQREFSVLAEGRHIDRNRKPR